MLPVSSGAPDEVAHFLDAMPRVTNNEDVVRRVVAVVLSLAVQAAAMGAPLVHAHPDEHATEHHAGRSLHTHWSGHDQAHHHSDTPAFTTADYDRAVFVNFFVAVAVAHIVAASAVPPVFLLAAPTERAAQRGLDVVRSHDPPHVRSLPSRAPPVFLS